MLRPSEPNCGKSLKAPQPHVSVMQTNARQKMARNIFREILTKLCRRMGLLGGFSFIYLPHCSLPNSQWLSRANPARCNKIFMLPCSITTRGGGWKYFDKILFLIHSKSEKVCGTAFSVKKICGKSA